MNTVRPQQPDCDPFYTKAWRPIAAYIYLLICLCDFMIMPIYYEYANNRVRAQQYVELALKFEGPVAQLESLKTLKETREWDPVTLKSNGLFHMAFGAILGVSAWTRGKEKIERVRKSGKKSDKNFMDDSSVDDKTAGGK